MAGKVSAKGATILIDDSSGTPQDISADCRSFEFNSDAGKVEVTGFTDGSKNYIPGMPVYDITLDFLWNSTATTGAKTVLQGIFGSSTSKTVKILPEAGGQYVSGEFMLENFPTKGTPDGAIEIGTVKFSVMGAVAPAWAS